ncbi:uncharacterized protein DNG_02959 [Cephalotrichum gorgonifer]|uniref:C2H2-type domain-containing protein n=1 Tax=Cephalotrichum gorgonifer TaxID=2041049 RepID=A0AAE8MVC3_9PEZI|nr:uncharacterized protein DNG_02959 [Cephalotrichum gorgonifer]
MDALLSLVLSLCWLCLDKTPFLEKNVLFAQYFDSLDSVQEAAISAGLCFAPGLLDVLESSTPPPLAWFKSLPTTFRDRWGVYLLVLEKPASPLLLYIGSGTSRQDHGLSSRMAHYDKKISLPQYVESALDEGYKITSKGALCWAPMPGYLHVPIVRLLFILLETTLAYAFWTMKAKNGDYGMGFLCKWDRSTLGYEGLCSHPALNEGIRGDFELSPEQLQVIEEERKEKFKFHHNKNNQKWHQKKMAEDREEYIRKSSERVAKSRANNPGRDIIRQAARHAKALAEEKHHYERCNLSFTTPGILQDHLKSAKHARKAKEATNPFICRPCNYGVANQSNLTRHYKTERHQKNVERFAKMAEEAKMADLDVAGPSGQSALDVN